MVNVILNADSGFLYYCCEAMYWFTGLRKRQCFDSEWIIIKLIIFIILVFIQNGNGLATDIMPSTTTAATPSPSSITNELTSIVTTAKNRHIEITTVITETRRSTIILKNRTAYSRGDDNNVSNTVSQLNYTIVPTKEYNKLIESSINSIELKNSNSNSDNKIVKSKNDLIYQPPQQLQQIQIKNLNNFLLQQKQLQLQQQTVLNSNTPTINNNKQLAKSTQNYVAITNFSNRSINSNSKTSNNNSSNKNDDIESNMIDNEMKIMNFSTENSTVVTYQVGSIAMIPCSVRNLNEGMMVSWIRRKDYHLITVGSTTYSSDERFSAIHLQDAEEWTLQVKFVQIRDIGIYECQVSTHPPTSIFIHLNVVEARAEIPRPTERYLKPGSTLRLSCKVLQSMESPSYLFWYHNNRMINYDLHRGVNVSTEPDCRFSELLIMQTSIIHSGNYTCAPNNAVSASVLVHILNGENPAAMQHGEHGYGLCVKPSYQLINYGIIILALIDRLYS